MGCHHPSSRGYHVLSTLQTLALLCRTSWYLSHIFLLPRIRSATQGRYCPDQLGSRTGGGVGGIPDQPDPKECIDQTEQTTDRGFQGLSKDMIQFYGGKWMGMKPNRTLIFVFCDVSLILFKTQLPEFLEANASTNSEIAAVCQIEMVTSIVINLSIYPSDQRIQNLAESCQQHPRNFFRSLKTCKNLARFLQHSCKILNALITRVMHTK